MPPTHQDAASVAPVIASAGARENERVTESASDDAPLDDSAAIEHAPDGDESDGAAVDEPAAAEGATERVTATGEATPAPPTTDADQACAPRRARGLPLSAALVTLVAIEAVVFFAFLLIEPTPRWLALFGTVVAALSFEGVLRGSVREPFASGADTAPYLFLPALYALVMPVFVEHTVGGLWVLAAGAVTVAGFAGVLLAELGSAQAQLPAYRPARLAAVLGAYAVAFALIDLTYLLDLDVVAAMAAVAVGAALLGVELLREGEIDPLETLGFAAIVGLVVAEARWTLHFLPLEGELAALALLLVFYVASGLLHAHLTRQLSARAAGEYTVISAAGLALVVVARATAIA